MEWCLLAVPFLFFPEVLISLFFKQEPTVMLKAALTLSCGWLWLFFLTDGLNMIGFGLLSAYGDTVFQMWFSLSAWVLYFLPTYFVIYHRSEAPEIFWFIISIACLIAASIYFIRLSKKTPNTTGADLEKIIS